MSYWDSSALVKLYVQELDSALFRELAVKASRVATGSLTRHEVRTVFRRREAFSRAAKPRLSTTS